MSTKIIIGIVAVVAAVLVASTITTASLANLAFAQTGQKFTAKLTGKDEVPPKETKATGTAEFNSMGTDSVTYSINATNIQGVTMGHIHSGKQGENGPIVVTLFKYSSPKDQVSENGKITADKLEGPMAGKKISDLTNAMTNGETYVNIHTEKNPKGEIRGQISSSSGSATGGNSTAQ